MKKPVALLLLVALLIHYYGALAERKVEFSPTTDENIAFYYIPWDISDSEFQEYLVALGVEFTSSYSDKSDAKGFGSRIAPSFSFEERKTFPFTESKSVPTREYVFDMESTFNVAGHPISRISASFYRNQDTTGLYEIEVFLSQHTSLSREEQYDDLKNKLTDLYGEPFAYTDEDAMTKFLYDNSAWLSSDGSAVCLSRKYTSYGRSVGLFLTYGIAIADDYSGL